MNDSTKLKQINIRAEKRKNTGKYFTLFLIVILFAFFLILAFNNLFNIKEIRVEGISETVPYTSEDISKFLDIKKDTNLLTYNTKKAEKALLFQFPYIKEIEIKRKLPSTLEVSIVENKGTLWFELGKDVFILSSEGRVLEIAESPSYDGKERTLLLTREVKRCVTGENVVFDKEEKIEILKEVTSALEKYSMLEKITQLDTTNKFDVKFVYDDKFKITFGTFEKADAKIKLLAEMLKSEIWKSSVGEIDISDPSEALVKFTGNVSN